MAGTRAKEEGKKADNDGRLVGSGRFDPLSEPGARVIREGERKASRKLKEAGASPGSADWNGASDTKPTPKESE